MGLKLAAGLIDHNLLLGNFLEGRVHWQGCFRILGIHKPHHHPTNTFAGRVHDQLFGRDFTFGKAMVLILVNFD
jgi:hypothetical protein